MRPRARTSRPGPLKALGVAAASERAELPGVPPVAATPGLAGFEAWPWQGFVAPAKTPAEIIAKLHDTYVAAVNDPVVRQKLIDAGLEPLQSSPRNSPTTAAARPPSGRSMAESKYRVLD